MNRLCCMVNPHHRCVSCGPICDDCTERRQETFHTGEKKLWLVCVCGSSLEGNLNDPLYFKPRSDE